MGHATKLWGYIDAHEAFAEENAERIVALPSEHESSTGIPLLTREMFAAPRLQYLGHLITFGRRYNGVETRWALWREQFEALLRTMYWDAAQVWVETDLWGDFHCSWKGRFAYEDDPTIEPPGGPTAKWDYHGPWANFSRG